MTYIPTSWNYTLDEKKNRTYEDPILNVVQENLKRASILVSDAAVDAKLNILYVQGNMNCKTVKDPTVQVIGLFTSKIIEGLGVIFPAGTATAVVTTIVCKVISGAISVVTSPSSKESYNQIQSKVNDLKEAVDEICVLVRVKISDWIKNMEKEWLVEYDSLGAKYPELKGKVKLADMAEAGTNYFPDQTDSDYIICREALNVASTYEATRELLPLRWKIRRHRAFPADTISNFISGWEVCFYKVRNRGTWDSWRNSSDFPNIPSNLSGDIEGPYEYQEKGDDAHSQRFMSWYETYRDYPWSDGSKFDDSRQWNGSRWMGFSGRKDYKIDEDDHSNLVQGTSFLDLIEDILSGIYDGYGDWQAKNSLPKEPSYYLWYKTKRHNEPEIVNDRRVWTLMGNDACQDWAYDSYDIFHWGRAYRGITLNHYTLVDENGNYAPTVLCDWLFKDDGHGKTINVAGVADKEDVYHHWGLSFE